MKIFLAGCSGRAYILELAKELGILWKSTLQEKMANGVSYQNYLGGKMKVYLAGGFTGNLAPEWKKIAIGGAEAYEHLFSRRASREERQTCEIHNRGGKE